MRRSRFAVPLALALGLAACAAPAARPTPPAATAPSTPAAGAAPATGPGGRLAVLATETFLADITRAVAGGRAEVEALLPIGVDPHAFEPTPADLRRVAEADLLVVNGGGIEGYLDEILDSAGGQRPLLVASAGIAPRAPRPEEPGAGEADHAGAAGHGHEEAGDPHFWLDPILVMDYARNIRQGLTQADPAGAADYAANAEAYTQRLADLDAEIRLLLGAIPEPERLLVTNHESLGYFADRYGFTLVGTLIPSASTGASPSARELAALVDRIRASGAPAIFLETGANPELAEQVAAETGVRVVTGLYTHSITGPDGPAPGYLDMMRANARAIAEALSGSG